eukprot:gene6309-7472_t
MDNSASVASKSLLLAFDLVIWNNIARWLNVIDVVRISETCRGLYQIAHKIDTRSLSDRGLVSAKATSQRHRQAWSNLRFPVRLRAHTEVAWTCIMLQHKPSILASAGWDCLILLWDLLKEECVVALEGHTSFVLTLSTVPNHPCLLLSGGQDRRVMLWNVETHKLECVLEHHTRTVTGIVALSDGNVAVSSSCDQTLCVWDLYKRCLRTVLRGHMAPVECVAVHPTQRRSVLSASDDGMLRLWNVDTAECFLQVEIGTATSSLCTVLTSINTSSRNLSAFRLGASLEQRLFEQQVTQQPRPTHYQRNDANPMDVHVAAPETSDMSESEASSARSMSPTAEQLHTCNHRPVACCVDGRGYARVVDLLTGQLVDRRLVHDQTLVECCVCLRDGQRLVTAGREAVLKLWRVDHKGSLVECARTPMNAVARCFVDLGDGRAAITTYTKFITLSTECPWLLN